LKLVKVRVGNHRIVNLSKRSLCDNCVAEVCAVQTPGRVEHCSHFASPFLAFRKCPGCGRVYEVFANFNALDLESCPECNRAHVVGLAAQPA
jgi:hypothetical protein